MSRGVEPNVGDGLSLVELIAQIDARLDVLGPLVQEFQQLESARNVLIADYGTGASRSTASSRRATTRPRRSRRAPRGANREAILRVAGERPGITVAEIAAATGIGKPTVHSTVYALKTRGELQRAGDGVSLAAAAGQPARRARSASSARRAAGRRSRRAARRAASAG